jgi:hypothetical protein
MHRPLQQSVAAVHVSPATRQKGSSWHEALPDSEVAQIPPQQSGFPMQASPAGLQLGGGGWQVPAMHAPPQQSRSVAHA